MTRVLSIDPPVPDASGVAPVDVSTFFAFSLDLLVIRDLAGRVVEASQSWRDVLGYDPDELKGTVLLNLVHPDDLPDTQRSVIEVETRPPGREAPDYINRYRHKAGGYRTLEWRAQRFGDHIYGVARDVTDRIAAERELIEAKAAAQAASRAKSDFLANVSHEIRTPLNGVIGVVDALSRTRLSVEQAEMVALVRESGVALERLVGDFLDVSKIEAGQLRLERRPFDLEAALHPCIEPMRYRAHEKGLDFQVETAADARGLFVGDGARIGQIVGNLLSNAVKFTQQGGVALRVAVADEADDARLIVEVEDTGVGFDAEHASRLFDRFSQADETISRRFGGTGLGLSICRSLCALMGGRIDAVSEPGVGSRFTVVLPAPRAETLTDYDARRDLAAPAPGRLPSRPLRVLLAEDNRMNQRVVHLILDTQGAQVVTVDDGVEAVAAYRTGAFDLVLMDIQMPRMDGLTATRAIREIEMGRAAPRTPIVVLSANAMAEHIDEALTAGADLHVAKPITAASLLAGITAAVGRG